MMDAPERIWVTCWPGKSDSGKWTGHDASGLYPCTEYIHIDAYNAAIASARAQVWQGAVEAAARAADDRADLCEWTDGEIEARKIAAAIRALSDRPDTIGPVIEAAKAFEAAIGKPGMELGSLRVRLAAALAAHEARHG